MEATPQLLPEIQPSTEKTTVESKSSSLRGWVIGIFALIILVGIVFGIIVLANAAPETTARVRDIFIIFMALEAFVLGVGLIVLIVQIAALINLVQNEIKPILDSTSETVNNLRGTTQFLSNNLVAPVIKLNETLAGISKFFTLIRPKGR
jgi:hypothetical protein